MRVIAGKHKGRRIECLEGKTIRPTSDMLRGAVFNMLNFNVDWEASNVLDVCCGTGAFGIEALSRGAAFVGFIDNARDSIEVTKHNLSKLGEDDKVSFTLSSVENLPVAKKQFHILYVDPPYLMGLVPKALRNLREKGWIAEGAIILAEVSERDKITAPEGFKIVEERRYGNSKLLNIRMI